MPTRAGKRSSGDLVDSLLCKFHFFRSHIIAASNDASISADKGRASAFIDTLGSRITSSATNVAPAELATLQAELQSHINTLRSNGQILANKVDTSAWRKRGTDIWNLSTRLDRTTWEASNDVAQAATATTRVYGLFRVFAFLLLHCAHRGKRKANNLDHKHELLRLLRIANKTVKACLKTSQLDLCTTVCERAADIDDEISKLLQDTIAGLDEDQPRTTNDTTEYGRLQLEYCALRIALVAVS